MVPEPALERAPPGLMTATAGTLLAHVPPEGLAVIVAPEPAQKKVGPEMADGTPFTVTTAVLAPQVPV